MLTSTKNMCHSSWQLTIFVCHDYNRLAGISISLRIRGIHRYAVIPVFRQTGQIRLSGWSPHHGRLWTAVRHQFKGHCITQYNSILISNKNSVPAHPNTGWAYVVSLDISWWRVWLYQKKKHASLYFKRFSAPTTPQINVFCAKTLL